MEEKVDMEKETYRLGNITITEHITPTQYDNFTIPIVSSSILFIIL